MIATRHGARRFPLVLIRPSHYDDDGYVIQWFRSAIPSNTLAVMYGLAQDCRERRVLGEDVEIVVTVYDETNTRLRLDRIVRQMQSGPGLVAFVGVQSNQFPRVMDMARPLRAAGVAVCMGGFHISGCVAMLPEPTPELKVAMALGISLFAGEAEGRFEQVLRDASNGQLQSLYNYLPDPPALAAVPLPILPANRVRRTSGNLTSFDAGRGCPFECSFCTIINVHGRRPRTRSADDVEQIVRANLRQGINRFFITDDNFTRNPAWESIFDRLIALREQEKLNLKFVLQVDTNCHRVPRFIEKAGRAGVARVFVGMESIAAENLKAVNKRQNRISEYREMLLAWKRARVMVFVGYILGFPGDTPESVARDIEIVQRELPVDLMEFHCLTPLPGSADHQRLYTTGAYLDPDLNKFDLEHVVMAHPTLTTAQWEKVYRDAWSAYYTEEHMERLLRRAAATGINPSNLVMMLMWFYNCFALEKLDPLQGGYLRRRRRRERRPGMPMESRWRFYSEWVRKLVGDHGKLVRLLWRLNRVRRSLKVDPEARAYTDEALAGFGKSEPSCRRDRAE